MDAYGQFASVYDKLMQDMPYEEWLQFAHDSWERYGMPKTVVDLGCGTGKDSHSTCSSDYKFMVSICRQIC